ncbi:MAG: 50S ribosomal protein L23 [Candidatus Saccharimonadales bacterium]
MSKTLFLKPRLSEQSYALAQKERVYVFDVPKKTDKVDLARSVAEQFEVKVLSVNVTHIKGKSKRIASINGKRRSNAQGSRNDIKKAYVKLAEGFSLPFFAAIEEAEEKEQAVQEKVDKAVAKQTKKDTETPKVGRRGIHLMRKKREEE